MIKYLLPIVLVSFALTGCGIIPDNDRLEVREGQVVYQTIPTELTEPCVPSNRPPSREEFLKFLPHEREASLARYIKHLLGDLRSCDIRMEKIRTLPVGNTSR